jgi:hypothetical protein
VKPEPRICTERLHPALSDSKSKVVKVSPFITAAQQEVEITPLSPQPTSNLDDDRNEEDLFKTPIPSQTRKSVKFNKDEAISSLADKIHLLTNEINNLSRLNESLIKEVQFWKAAYEKRGDKSSRSIRLSATNPCNGSGSGPSPKSELQNIFKKGFSKSKTKDGIESLEFYSTVINSSKFDETSEFWHRKFENAEKELVVFKGLYLSTFNDVYEERPSQEGILSVPELQRRVLQMKAQVNSLVKENNRLSSSFNRLSDEMEFLKMNNPTVEERDEFLKNLLKRALESKDERESLQNEEISKLKYEITCLRGNLERRARKNLNCSAEMGIPEENCGYDAVYLEEVIDNEVNT